MYDFGSLLLWVYHIVVYMVLVFDINKVFGWSYNPYTLQVMLLLLLLGKISNNRMCILISNYYAIALNADYPLSFYYFM